MTGQNGDILDPLAQGRHMQWVHAETVIEIRTKAPLLDLHRQQPIGCGDDADIDPVTLIGTHPLNFAKLDRSQQLCLNRQRQFAHFIKKQGAALGQFKLADTIPAGAGKRAPHVPEQLTFRERLRKCRAIDMHQRLLRTQRARMDDPGQHLLADPGLTHQQYRQIRAGDDIDFTVEFLHRGTLAQNGVAALQRLAHQLGGDLAAMFGQCFQRVDIGLITQ